MILSCPRCENTQLNNGSHGTSICSKCSGIFVPRSSVSESLVDSAMGSTCSAPEAGQGIRCPNDKILMSRARIETSSDGKAIYLDRCSSCLGVWFDAGEWGTLSSGHLLEHLDEFWSEEWRRRQRETHERQAYTERLQETFGIELYTRLLNIAHELRNHPRRSQALAVIREESVPR